MIEIYTDGACSGNPGPGGWGVLLRIGNDETELCGGEPATTNNRMELTAVIRGLQTLKEPCEVTVITDSQYLRQGITAWIQKWKRNGWKATGGAPVKNQDLWMSLELALQPHTVRWTWVKGHADHTDNIEADRLATAAARGQTIAG